MPKKQSGMAQDWTQNHAAPLRCCPNKNSVMYQLSYWAIPRKEFLIVLKSQNFVPDMTPQPKNYRLPKPWTGLVDRSSPTAELVSVTELWSSSHGFRFRPEFGTGQQQHYLWEIPNWSDIMLLFSFNHNLVHCMPPLWHLGSTHK